ncbi:MAG: glutamate racemase [Candidatus Doudnabacteria bacterium]
MKIGFFDSGLGGLYLLKAVANRLPKYDYVFLGDTKNLPYGEKSRKQIYNLTGKAIKFLFDRGCLLVIVACNTSSSQALRKIQKEYLPTNFAGRKVLGVIRPTVELISAGDVCVLATTGTVRARAYTRELRKINPKLRVFELPAPELVLLLETGQLGKLKSAVAKYTGLVNDKKVKNLILGCTHYAVIKDQFARGLGRGIKLISQDEIIPVKLADYLGRHPEIENKLSKRKDRKFYVTKLNRDFLLNAKKWFGKKISLELARY